MTIVEKWKASIGGTWSNGATSRNTGRSSRGCGWGSPGSGPRPGASRRSRLRGWREGWMRGRPGALMERKRWWKVPKPTWRCEHVAEGVGDHGGLLVDDEFEALRADELDDACRVVVVLLLLGLVVLTRRRHPATCDFDWIGIEVGDWIGIEIEIGVGCSIDLVSQEAGLSILRPRKSDAEREFLLHARVITLISISLDLRCIWPDEMYIDKVYDTTRNVFINDESLMTLTIFITELGHSMTKFVASSWLTSDRALTRRIVTKMETTSLIIETKSS